MWANVIAPFTGLLIHERSGFERGGFGAFPSENGDLVALGLDTSRGEALSLIAYNEGMIGVYLNDGGDFMSSPPCPQYHLTNSNRYRGPGRSASR